MLSEGTGVSWPRKLESTFAYFMKFSITFIVVKLCISKENKSDVVK